MTWWQSLLGMLGAFVLGYLVKGLQSRSVAAYVPPPAPGPVPTPEEAARRKEEHDAIDAASDSDVLRRARERWDKPG